jgi:hypothetical protein
VAFFLTRNGRTSSGNNINGDIEHPDFLAELEKRTVTVAFLENI